MQLAGVSRNNEASAYYLSAALQLVTAPCHTGGHSMADHAPAFKGLSALSAPEGQTAVICELMEPQHLRAAVHGLLVAQQEAVAICCAHTQLSLQQPAWKLVDPLKGSIVCWTDGEHEALRLGQVLQTQVQQPPGTASSAWPAAACSACNTHCRRQPMQTSN